MARIDLRKLNCTVMSISNTTPNLRIQMQYVMEKNRLQNRHCFLTCPPFQFVARVRHSWLVASKFRNRSWWNSKEDLLRGVNQPKPTQSLASTAAWFVGLLKLADFECLMSRVRALDGACLRFGTTCSGIDARSNILRH